MTFVLVKGDILVKRDTLIERDILVERRIRGQPLRRPNRCSTIADI